nr:probable RNA-dependent RNA polymerase 1 isoform X1 [Ipomoea batatas]
MEKTVQVSGFPDLVTAEEAKTCIEKHTGAGSVCPLEVKMRLYFGTSYLRAFEMDTRIVQDRSYTHEMENLTLYFGCQTSDKRFYSIWGGGIVSIKFGYGLKKMHLFLSYQSTEYKLQLSYEHIWEIKLYRPHRRNVKFLVIQVDKRLKVFQDQLIDGDEAVQMEVSNDHFTDWWSF